MVFCFVSIIIDSILSWCETLWVPVSHVGVLSGTTMPFIWCEHRCGEVEVFHRTIIFFFIIKRNLGDGFELFFFFSSGIFHVD